MSEIDWITNVGSSACRVELAVHTDQDSEQRSRVGGRGRQDLTLVDVSRSFCTTSLRPQIGTLFSGKNAVHPASHNPRHVLIILDS
jgi:hypothetical protein